MPLPAVSTRPEVIEASRWPVYLWRHQIVAAVDAGYRAIAPDLVGMGLSDKPSEMSDYSVARHVGWMRAVLFDQLGLTDCDASGIVSAFGWLIAERRCGSMAL